MEILLDGNTIKSKEDLFETLKEQIDSDEFHGSNLDALWEVLQQYTDELQISIRNVEAFKDNLGDYTALLLNLFVDLVESNPGVILIVK